MFEGFLKYCRSRTDRPWPPPPPAWRNVREDIRPPPPPPPPPPKRFMKEGYYEVSFDEHEKQNQAPDPIERIAIALERIAEELEKRSKP